MKNEIKSEVVRRLVEELWHKERWNEQNPSKADMLDLIARVEEIVAREAFRAARKTYWSEMTRCDEWQYIDDIDYLSTLTQQENGG